ncbi:hypothetical protein [Methylorubrum thiocyanatum]|uniref:hypothetical protein n=1 Tax=Methylorubrum thiocyanatum TaxID=47958 RepID=UPI0035C79C20
MARYNRRERHDYSYLRYATPSQAFEQSYRDLPFGNRREWPANVNRQLLTLFEGRDSLHADAATVAFSNMFDPATVATWSPEFLASRVGNALGWGVRLGVVQEVIEDGRRVWRMPDREPWWETDPRGNARQIRGLPDGEQAALNRRRAAHAKAAATRQANEAAARAPVIEGIVNALLLLEPDWNCPDTKRWREALPGVALPCPLVEIRPIVLDAHRAMTPRAQHIWQGELAGCESHARYLAGRRERDAAQAVDDAAMEGL